MGGFLEERCGKFPNWRCTKFNSYLVLQLPDSLRFIVFKPREQSNLYHVNLTGVKTQQENKHEREAREKGILGWS